MLFDLVCLALAHKKFVTNSDDVNEKNKKSWVGTKNCAATCLILSINELGWNIFEIFKTLENKTITVF